MDKTGCQRRLLRHPSYLPMTLHLRPLSLLRLFRQAALVAFAAVCLFAPFIARADEPPSDFNAAARYVPGEKESVVQIPRYTFRGPDGQTVELTGVIHIAEKAYYDQLNEHLKQFDAVLFEMLVDAEALKKFTRKGATLEEKAAAMKSPLSHLYHLVAHDILGMELQTETVDYSAANFVWADLTEAEFASLLKEKGHTLDSLLSSATGANVNLEKMAEQMPKLKAMLPKGDPHAMKRMFAPMIGQLKLSESGPAQELILDQRNRRVMEVLDRELKAGRKSISIFFGSAHMKDLAKQLTARGWKKTDEKWINAWTIPAAAPTAPTPAPAPAPASKTPPQPVSGDSK